MQNGVESAMPGGRVPEPSKHAPDPHGFDTVVDWLRAALTAHGESPMRIALEAGLSKNALKEWLTHPDRKPKTTTVDRLATYFDVSQVELRALLALMPKNPNRVAAGHRAVASMGRERVAENMARAQAAAAAARPQQLKVQGVAARRRRSSEQWQQMQIAAADTRRARGWMSAEERAAMSERVRSTGQSSLGAHAAHAKYGLKHPGVLALREIARAKRNGEEVVCEQCKDPTRPIYRTPSKAQQGKKRYHADCWYRWLRSPEGRATILQRFADYLKKPLGTWRPCLFCNDAERLIWQTPSHVARGERQYHRTCFEAWRRTDGQRELFRKHMTVTLIWNKVRLSGDEKLKDRVWEQVKSQRAYLKNPTRRGAPPKLLEHREIAIAATIMHDEYGMSTTAIGEIAGWDRSASGYRDSRGNKGAHRWAWEMVRFGRVLLGTSDSDSKP